MRGDGDRFIAGETRDLRLRVMRGVDGVRPPDVPSPGDNNLYGVPPAAPAAAVSFNTDDRLAFRALM